MHVGAALPPLTKSDRDVECMLEPHASLSARHMLDISAVLTGQCGSNMSFQQLRHACFTHAILAGIIGIGYMRTTNKQASPTVIAE